MADDVWTLAAKEKEAREDRIRDALDYSRGIVFSREARCKIAECLYESRYATTEERLDASLLSDLCFAIFGADTDEVIEAWDRFLG